ncbi:TetR/AcrR family transcriptional regulator [Cupriavidus pauculus]|uniref:TetR/AcrR family transcriptional regulator n=1 Tax=Cupriavidus pauculus TaxID=82633 RepID=UPI00203F1B7E|nr:TetR/AcrR family transcriptional regulator [Cupriavidus pauculus]MCM3606073.1 TetR/AcrR family transcriptional regulator [Cupriavidus pauculus]
MQDKKTQSNQLRTQATRAALLGAARRLLIEKGYAATSTPEIAAAAGITRGALYHHFADKQDLYRTLLEDEARAVADEIERAAPHDVPIRDALIAGSLAYLKAMRVPGRTQLLLIDGPAVLGAAEIFALDARHAGRTLREGLRAAVGHGLADDAPADALAALLSAAFDRAALEIAAGADAASFEAAIVGLIDRTVAAPAGAWAGSARTR